MKRQYGDIRKLCNSLWEIEKKFDLLGWEIDGVFPWQVCRMKAYYHIATKAGVIDSPHPQKFGFFEQTVNAFRTTYYSILSITTLIKLKFCNYDSVFYEHERCGLANGKNVDIYSHYIQARLVANGEKIIRFERPIRRRHIKNGNLGSCLYLDGVLLFGNLKAKLYKVNFSETDLERFEAVQDYIYQSLGIKVNLKKIFSEAIKRYHGFLPVYTSLFTWCGSKQLYIVVPYGFPEVVKSAKVAGLKVTELQHGIISKYHLGYSYPDVESSKVKYFPDQIITWGESWLPQIDMPIDKKDVILGSFDHLENVVSAFESSSQKTSKIQNSICIISQGAIGKDLIRIVLDDICALKNYIIFIKLHPSEVEGWKSNEVYLDASLYHNVHIVTDESIYSILAKCEYALGAFSTSLLESFYFNCRVIQVQLPGSEYLEDIKGIIEYNEFISTVSN